MKMNLKKCEDKKEFYTCPHCGYKRKIHIKEESIVNEKEIICSNCFGFSTLMYLKTDNDISTKILQIQNRNLALEAGNTIKENRKMIQNIIKKLALDLEVL